MNNKLYFVLIALTAVVVTLLNYSPFIRICLEFVASLICMAGIVITGIAVLTKSMRSVFLIN